MDETLCRAAPERVARVLREAGCVFAEDEAALLIAEAASDAALQQMVRRRVAGEPLEQIVGWAEFCGLRVGLAPGVFVPRRRSELLVEVGCDALGDLDDLCCVDLCCGSGAIGLALAHAVPGLRLYAVDLDLAAVRCARANLGDVGGTVLMGDLDAPLPPTLRGSVGLVVVNAPYVPSADIGLMPREARDHEPLLALDGGPDGVGVQRRAAAAAARLLAPGGAVVIETSRRQSGPTRRAIEDCGLAASVVESKPLDAVAVVGELV